MTVRLSLLYAALLFATVSSVAQKELPPQGGEPKDFVLPKTETIALDNGLRVTFVPYGTIPKVSVYAIVRTGHIDESADQIWLSDLTGELMKEGTTSRTAEILAKDAASIGGSINVSVGDERVFVSGDALAEYGAKIVALVADVARNPRFPESELARLKNNLVRRVSIARAEPQSMAFEKFRSVLYGDHPFGRTLPTEAMVSSYTLDQVKDFYTRNFSAARTHLYIAGKFERAGVEKAFREGFGDWARGSAPTVNPPKPSSRRAIYIVDRPGASQSTIYMGLPVTDPSSPEWIPQVVMNSLLGGSFGSRITSNIRENKGYTYSPGGAVSSRYRDAYWLETADVSTEVTGASLREIFHEIDSLQAVPPGVDELKGIQNYEAGLFVLRNSAPGMIVNILAFMDLHGLDEGYLANYIKNVHAVTPEKVREVTQKYIRDDEMLIVIAGDAKKIEKQIAPYGPIVRR